MLILFLTFDTPEDVDKFLLLYEKYRKTIYYTLTKFEFDEYTKEDLSHDIYIKLADHLDDIDIKDFKKHKITLLQLPAITVSIIYAIKAENLNLFWKIFQICEQIPKVSWNSLSTRSRYIGWRQKLINLTTFINLYWS